MSNALISDCEKYRYWLTRSCENMFPEKGSALFVMLNPSTADANIDDPTIRRCIGFARSWDCNSLTVANLYAYRATKPSELWKCNDPIGPDNDRWLWKLAKEHGDIVCAWGDQAKPERVKEFKKIAKEADVKLWCLGTNKSGSPKHPLYLKADQKLVKWD